MIALVLLSGVVAAAPAAGLAGATPVEAAIAATLPAHLVLVDATIPARIAQLAAAPGAPVIVEWRSPPRAGSSRVSITAGTARAWVPVQVAEQAERPTAARPLPIGHVVTEEDLVLELIPGARAPLSPALVIGATVRAPVLPGDELTSEVLALRPPLPRGTPITVVARAGGVTVTRAGRLETASRVGELAKIRLDDTTGLARARLDSPTTAVLETTR